MASINQSSPSQWNKNLSSLSNHEHDINPSGLGNQSEIPGRQIHSKLDSEFIDIDPILKNLKGGYLMQRTFLKNNANSRMHGSKLQDHSTMELQSQTKYLARTIDWGSQKGESTTDIGSSGTALQLNRVGGQGTGGPSCNYQNVDLFKIPDSTRVGKKQRNQKHQRLSAIEKHRTFATLQVDQDSLDNQDSIHNRSLDHYSQKQLDSLEQMPEDIIKDAVHEARLNQQIKKRSKFDMHNASTFNRAGISAVQWDLRSHSETNHLSHQSPSQRFPTGVKNIQIGGQQWQNTQVSGDDYFRSARVSDGSNNLNNQQFDSKFNSQRQMPGLNIPNFGSGLIQQSAQNETNQSPTYINQPQIGTFPSSKHAQETKLNMKSKTSYQTPGKEFQSHNDSVDADELEKLRKTPVLHMQFDELASIQLNGTYENKFKKKQILQRRNPLKYMKNPNSVFGVTHGARQYTFQDKEKVDSMNQTQRIEFGGTLRSALQTQSLVSTNRSGPFWQASSNPNETFQSLPPDIHTPNIGKNGQSPFSIKIHNLAKNPNGGGDDTDIMQPVTQIQGRGSSIEPPTDRSFVINNVIKPFKATSEVDRQRATQILDYIIERRKMAEKRDAQMLGARKNSEHAELLQQIEDEKQAKRRKLRKGDHSASEQEESSLDEFEKNDKYGSVLQSDLDRITGGMQTVKASNLNLNQIIRNDISAGLKPTQGDVNFLVEQLETNEFFNKFVDQYDKTLNKKLNTLPAIKKYNLKGPIQDKMLEQSPVRKAQKIVAQGSSSRKLMNPVSLNNQSKKASVSMMIVEDEIESLIEGAAISKTSPRKFTVDNSKDKFSNMNKNIMNSKQQYHQHKHERMKKYGRWLFFNGVENLPSDQKKVYAYEKAKEAERKLRKALSRSPKRTFESKNLESNEISPVQVANNISHFAGPIEELNENSRDEGEKTPITSNLG